MAYQLVFKRREVKYLVSRDDVPRLKEAMLERMRPDEHGRSTLCNVYLDTPDHLLIRRSLEHPLYKEKLRVRSYGVATADSPAFIEIKKKYKSTVYKRRVATTQQAARDYLLGGVRLPDSQVVREIDFLLERYANLEPAVFLSYEREAFFATDDREFRITFDDNVLWRDHDVSLAAGIGGEALLPEGRVLMEVKAGGAYPLWATRMLSEFQLYPGTFSKYGRAYGRICEQARSAAMPTAGRAPANPATADTVTAATPAA